MSTAKIESIKKELSVDVSQKDAFVVFTENMDLWWPRSHHIGKTPMVELVLEPGVNGRWYSRHEDGTEANVGYVLVWEPYGKIILAWQVNGDFQYNPTLITEVEVKFTPEGDHKTRVNLEHRNLERLAAGKTIESMDTGWGQILELYKMTTLTIK